MWKSISASKKWSRTMRRFIEEPPTQSGSDFNPQITQITQITIHVWWIAKSAGFNSPQLAAFG